MKKILGELDDYRLEKRQNSIVAPLRPCDLPLLCAITKAQSIVDYGGSSGWVWDYLKECNLEYNIERYIVIEIKNIVDYFNNSNIHSNPVRYMTVEEYNGNCNIFYTNSVLQYIGDDTIFFNLISRINPDFILIEDFLGGDIDEYYSLQIYYEDRIPQKFRNIGTFISQMKNIDYMLILEKPYITAQRGKIRTLSMSNFPKEKILLYTKTLIFKKFK